MSASAAHYAQLLLTASDELLLLLDGQTLQILAVNPAATQALGYTESQLLGRRIGDIECALSDVFFWDEVANKLGPQRAESEFRRVDGTTFAVDKRVQQLSAEPLIYGLRAKPTSAHGQIESELLNLGSRLRAILEATADGILVLDQAGSIMNMNQRLSELWKLPKGLLVQHDDAAVFKHMRALCVDGDPMPRPAAMDADPSDVATLRLHDGRVFECAVHNATSGQEVVGQVYSYRDITERHNTQQELIAARDQAKRGSEAKSAFLAMMSHEIRTPLNGVLGFAQLLAGTHLDEDQAEYVHIIESSGQTLLSILNDVLDFSKIEAGKMELERTDFHFPALLEDVAALFRFRQNKPGPELSLSADPQIPPDLVGDPVRLRQILFNLVGNAFKFTERGRIQVQVDMLPTSTADDPQTGLIGLAFSVRDSGIGISPEQQTRLFHSFEQADGSTTRKYGGTGLGLAICKRLVEMMGGQISVTSQLGQGSEFKFTVWLAAVPALAERPPRLANPVWPSSAASQPEAARPYRLDPNWQILLVEDNPVNRMFVQGLLRRLGASAPSVAENGQIALDLAAQHPFDLVLMDMQMPVLDGVGATRGLRQLGFAGPIIGLSAGALPEERQAALDAGADDYLLKPLQADALTQVLARLMPSQNG